MTMWFSKKYQINDQLFDKKMQLEILKRLIYLKKIFLNFK
jgi:hypothetical protein